MKNHYRTRLVLLCFALLATIAGSAQIYQIIPNYGQTHKRVKVLTNLTIPSGAVLPASPDGDQDPGSVFFNTANGKLYVWDGSAYLLQGAAGAGGGATALGELSDVSLSSLASGNFLRYNGAAWVNASLAVPDIPNLPASVVTSGVFPVARLGTGTYSSSTVLRGDGTFGAVPAGAVGTLQQVTTNGNTTNTTINAAGFNTAGNMIAFGYGEFSGNVYTPNLILGTGTFRGAVMPATYTAARTYTLPDKSGTIALLSDIGGGGVDLSGLVEKTTTLTINGQTFDLSTSRSWTISGLPDQTGNGGKILSTNGTVASWISSPDLSGYVPTARTLTINGTTFDLSANRSWTIGTPDLSPYLLSATAASTYATKATTLTINGQTLDLSANRSWTVETGLTAESDPLYTANGVPKTRTLTINGQAFDLSANRSWTISTGSSALSALTDVALSAPGSGQYLTYNGTAWVNSTLNLSAYLTAEVDGSTTNEIQTLSLAGQDLTISGGNTITLPTPAVAVNATQIAYGSGSNTLTYSAGFTYSSATGYLTTSGANGEPRLVIKSGTNGTGFLQFTEGTVDNWLVGKLGNKNWTFARYNSSGVFQGHDLQIDYATGNLLVNTLKTGGSAPTQTGSVMMVTTDGNGRLGFQTVPAGGGSADGNNYTSAIDFDISTGDFTLQRTGLGTLTKNLDGRYLTSAALSPYLTTATAATTYQPLDADLTAIAGQTTTGFLKRTGANTWALDGATYLTSADLSNYVTVNGAQTITGSKTFTSKPLAVAWHVSNTGTMATPPTNEGVYYMKNDGLPYFMNAAGAEMALYNTGGGTSYTNEEAQDAVGAMVSGEFTYTDATPLLSINSIASSKITGLATVATSGLYTDLTGRPDLSVYATTASLSGYVPTARTLTINGTTFDLSANRSWTISGGGGDPLPSQTGNSGKYLTTNGTTAAWTTAPFFYEIAASGDTAVNFLRQDGTFSQIAFNLSGASPDLSPYLLSATAASTYATKATTLTINGTTFDLSANRSWTISGGGGDPLPAQAGNAGKYLKTDGTTANWIVPPFFYEIAAGTGGNSVKFLRQDGTFSEVEFNLSGGSPDLSAYLTSATAATTYVPQVRTITINGTTFDLSANRSWTISGGGGDPLPSQTGNSGKYLTTNGTTAAWTTAPFFYEIAASGDTAVNFLRQDGTFSQIAFNLSGASVDLSGYLTTAAAFTTYVTQANAATYFATIASLSGYVPTERTITINGQTFDLSADRSWTVTAAAPDLSNYVTLDGAQTISGGKIWTSTQSFGTVQISGGIFVDGLGISLTEQAGTMSTPVSGKGFVYAKPDGKLYYKNSAGTDYDLTEVGSAGTAYTLPIASASTLGGVKVGAGLSIDGAGVLSTSLTLASGNYTPTLTNDQNISSSFAYPFQYMRVGNTVTVSGRIDITPTASSSQSYLRFSLPIASNLTGNNQAVGAAASASANVAAAVYGVAASDDMHLDFTPISTTLRQYYITFTYTIQ